MQRTALSLRGLEIFQLVAKSGSVGKVAAETGLSISTVSHHLRGVEETLGVSLLDHSRRPMVLTPAGSTFARYVEEGLRLIRRGEIELTSGDLSQIRELRFGIVDDFDNEIAPDLTRFLARAMPKCTFNHHTRPSLDIIRLLSEQKLDIGVATRPMTDVFGLTEYPLLRDPFVIALPARSTEAPETCLAGRSKLPFLRYSRNLIIGNLIEAHLRRLRMSLPNRFEFESNQSIISMVADGSGWVITTPSCYLRARRFHDRVTLHPFPSQGFVRTLSLFTTEDYPQNVTDMIATTLRRLITRHMIEPLSTQTPWLASSFRLLSAEEGSRETA
jgi:DNA-binding transcriptional LysR family regulator